MDEENKIEFSDPGTIVFFILAIISDFCFLGLLGLVIPGVGLAIAMFVLFAHYFFGLVILFYFWGKTRGWLPKLWLLLAWVVPLPSLTSSIIAAILLSNKVVAMVVEQVAIQAVAAATAGAGEALEATAVAGEGAEVAAAGAEAAGAATEGAGVVGEAGGAAIEEGAQGAEAGVKGAEEAEEAGENIDLESPEEKNPMENLEGELNQPSEEEFREGEGFKEEGEPEENEPEKKSKAADRLKKAFDIADRTNKSEDEEDEDDSEELPMAA